MSDSPAAILYDSSGNALLGSKTVAQSVPVTLPSDQTPIANVSTTGTISALNGTVALAAQGYASGVAVITGTWVGTLVIEVSADGGTNWYQGAFVTPVAVVAPLPIPGITVIANGTYSLIGLGAVTHIRIRASVYSSGTVSVRLVLSSAVPGLLNFTAILQSAVVSLYNNSTTNLASAASFTGTGESTLGTNAIQVNFKSDQPCTVQCQQSTDGTNWDIADSFYVPAGTGDGRTFQAVAAYYRTVVTNLGGATSTYLRLQSILCPVVEAVPRALSSGGGLKTDDGVCSGGWMPAPETTFFGLERGARVPLTVAPDGSLQCFSEATTDAGSFRDDFITALTSNLTGTVTLINGSTHMTGSGCAFLTELNRFSFVKGSAAAEGTLASVANVIDDNTVILATPYTGASVTGTVVVATWDTNTGTGGSITVANSLLTIASGTTSGQNSYVQRGSDYAPMEKTFRFNVSQRIANQTVRMGFFDNFANPKYQACIELTGTVNTQVSLITRSNTGVNDVETVTATLPTGINTATLLNLKIDLHPDRCSLFFDPADGSSPTFLAMCKNHIPPPYFSLQSGHGILNTGAPASTTSVNFDMVALNDYNALFTKAEELAVPDTIGTTCTSVAAAVADTVLAAANLNRGIVTVHNDSSSVLYLKLGTGASPTSFTVRMAPQGYYELPLGSGDRVYTGSINGYWSSASGSARVTEVV